MLVRGAPITSTNTKRPTGRQIAHAIFKREYRFGSQKGLVESLHGYS